MKRNASNAYSLGALVQLEPVVDPVIETFLKVLDERYADTREGVRLLGS
jgi:hypothetical protein